jgi:hypothetical protein
MWINLVGIEDLNQIDDKYDVHLISKNPAQPHPLWLLNFEN